MFSCSLSTSGCLLKDPGSCLAPSETSWSVLSRTLNFCEVSNYYLVVQQFYHRLSRLLLAPLRKSVPVNSSNSGWPTVSPLQDRSIPLSQFISQESLRISKIGNICPCSFIRLNSTI